MQAKRFRRRSGFTLMELIVVIAIIGLLAGMLMTAFSKARTGAKKTRARADLDQIKAAWENYVQEYRTFPAGISEMGEEAIAILSGANQDENPEKIIFMDFRQDEAGSFRDPWGQVYHVALDVDGDDLVSVNGQDVRVIVAAWSDGPDGQPQSGDELTSWK